MICLHGGKSMTPHLGKYCSLLFLPATLWSQSETINWPFWAHMMHFKGTQRCLVHCFRYYRDGKTPLGGPRQGRRCQDTVKNSSANLDCVCREKHLFTLIIYCKKPEKNRIESVTWPGWDKRWLYPPLKRQSWMTHEIYALKIRCAIFRNSFFAVWWIFVQL